MSKRQSRFVTIVAFTWMAFVMIFMSLYEGNDQSGFTQMVSSAVLIVVAIFFCYGVLAIVRDISLFGWSWTVDAWKKFIDQIK